MVNWVNLVDAIFSPCLFAGEYRSRSATMATERSDYSQTHFTEVRNKASVTDITAEIIGQPKPTLATIGKRASRGENHYLDFPMSVTFQIFPSSN